MKSSLLFHILTQKHECKTQWLKKYQKCLLVSELLLFRSCNVEKIVSFNALPPHSLNCNSVMLFLLL